MDRFLMCPPEYFGIEYEINVHMDKTNKVKRKKAMKQWEALRDLIVSLGAKVELIKPIEGLPDMVFTANAGLVHENRVALARFSCIERQGEEPLFDDFFRNQTALRQAEGNYFEGSGDSFIMDDTLYLGYGFRSRLTAASSLLNFLNLRKLVTCHLIDPRFYHLDTCFCPLNQEQVLYYPGAFDDLTQRTSFLKRSIADDWIIVPEEEAARFACNAVVINKNVILPLYCPRTMESLENAGYTYHVLDMSEFLKAGGACKCLTLKL